MFQKYISLKLIQTTFLIENLKLRFWDQKGVKRAQNEVFQILSKVNSYNFSGFFCITLQQHKGLKLEKLIFREKDCAEVFGPKRAQHETEFH